jgi:hypothetical protein
MGVREQMVKPATVAVAYFAFLNLWSFTGMIHLHNKHQRHKAVPNWFIVKFETAEVAGEYYLGG